jgi:hypothetical protein
MGRYPNTRKRQGFAVALMLALAVAVPARAQYEPAPVWQAVDAGTGRLTGVTDLQALLVMFPDSASVRRRLLNAYLEAERSADALAEAVELVRRGYAFSPAAQEMLVTLGPTEEQRSVLGLQSTHAESTEASTLLATVPAEIHLVESVWRDPRSGDLFVASVVSRALHVRRGEGAWTPIELEGAGSLTGMGFDPRSGLLWLGSGVFDQTPDPATAFRGVIAIDPATGHEKRRIAAPEGGSPSDLAIDGNGTVYVSDPISGAIYRARIGEATLDTFVPPGTFRSPQGIVALPGSSHIVVSDYVYGLALVDVGTGSIHRIAAGTPVLLDGIDGLWLEGDRLVAVQNGAQPVRIVELTLSADWTRVVAAAVREKAHPGWTEPVGGNISNGELIYVATGQWERFGDGGALAGERAPAQTEIRALQLLPSLR